MGFKICFKSLECGTVMKLGRQRIPRAGIDTEKLRPARARRLRGTARRTVALAERSALIGVFRLTMEPM